MSDLSEKLQQASSKNHELLDTLRETDYAPPANQQNNAYIADLQQQIAKIEKKLDLYHTKAEEERADHLRWKDSVFKRYVSKLGGHRGRDKFDAKAEKEEREFLEAWQREKEANDAISNLRDALGDAEKQKQTLENDKARCERAQQELDQLYNSIFAGPTPAVPGEDHVENEVQRARTWYEHCQMQSDRNKQALTALQRAGPAMGYAAQHLQDARESSQMDMLGGGALFDMMERDHLHKGQMYLSHVLRDMDEAVRAQPAIERLSDVTIDDGHLMSDVLFDNILSDMNQHARIKEAQDQMHRAAQQLKVETARQEERAGKARQEMEEAQAKLEEARKSLQGIRSEAFEQFAGGAPPAYSADG